MDRRERIREIAESICGEHHEAFKKLVEAERSGRRVPPQEGGCYFCYTVKNPEDLVFDTEFDAYVHRECIKKGIAEGNPEAEIMSYLLE